MASEDERRSTLAFARLLGHLLGDGSISREGQARVNVGQKFDREAVLNDIELLTAKRPKATAYDERKWSIVLPLELTQSVLSLAGVRVGRRIDQPAFLPDFLLRPECPVSVIREFVGGTFGADGHAPTLHRYGKTTEQASLEPPMYSQSAKPEFVDSTRQKMDHIIALLSRCGVEVSGAVVREYPTRSLGLDLSQCAGRNRATGDPSGAAGWAFLRRADRLSLLHRQDAASECGRRLLAHARDDQPPAAVDGRSTRAHVPLRVQRPFARWRSIAAAELAEIETPIFRTTRCSKDMIGSRDCRRRRRVPSGLYTGRVAGFPRLHELFEQLGVSHWFGALRGRESLDHAKRYCLDKESLTLPALELAHHRPSRRGTPAGIRYCRARGPGIPRR